MRSHHPLSRIRRDAQPVPSYQGSRDTSWPGGTLVNMERDDDGLLGPADEGAAGDRKDQVESAVYWIMASLGDRAVGRGDSEDVLDFLRRRVERDVLFAPPITDGDLRVAVERALDLLASPHTREWLVRLRDRLRDDAAPVAAPESRRIVVSAGYGGFALSEEARSPVGRARVRGT